MTDEQSSHGPGLPARTPDDVPVSDRWSCLTCGALTRPGTQPSERLLGGWVRVHCASCGNLRIATPVPQPQEDQPEP